MNQFNLIIEVPGSFLGAGSHVCFGCQDPLSIQVCSTPESDKPYCAPPIRSSWNLQNFPSLRSHPLPQPFLLLIRPIPAIQPNEHRRVWERHARLQHQDVERLAGVVEPRDDLLMR
jgi:hypothetical protein